MLIGNDIQMATGAALLITALSEATSSLDLYHHRLVYETASLVGPAGAAAMICSTYSVSETQHHNTLKVRITKTWKTGRARVLYVYAGLFAAFSIWLGVRLGQWDYDQMGKCYRAGITAYPGADHPTADIIYLSITACWMVVTLAISVFGNANRVRTVIILAAVQFPVHLFMMIAIRQANTGHLEGDESEDDWEFGQTVCILLLYLSGKEAWAGVKHYYKYEKIALREGKAQTMDLEQLQKIQEHIIAGELH